MISESSFLSSMIFIYVVCRFANNSNDNDDNTDDDDNNNNNCL